MSTPSICAECGHDQVGPRPAPPLVSFAALWPVALIVLVLVALFLALRADVTSSSGSISWGLPVIGSTPTTADDLVELAAGRPGPDLYQRLLDRRNADTQFGWFPDSRIEFTYVAFSNTRRSSFMIGWPIRMWSSSSASVFDDPVRAVGFRPLTTHPQLKPNPKVINPHVFEGKSVPVPRWAWRGGMVQFAPPPEERDGRLETRSVFLLGVGATLGLIAFAWLLGGAVGFLLDVRRQRRRRPLIGRRIRRWSAVLATLAIVFGTITNARSNVQIAQDSSTVEQTESLPAPRISVAELLEHQTASDRNRWLASQLLEQLRPHAEAIRRGPSQSAERPLALATNVTTTWESRHEWTSWGNIFPLVSTDDWTYVPPAEDAAAVRELPAFDISYDGRRVNVHRSPGPNRSVTFSVDVHGLGTVALGIFLLAAGCAAVRAVATRVQTSRRRRRCACIACGHPLPRTAPVVG